MKEKKVALTNKFYNNFTKYLFYCGDVNLRVWQSK